MNFSPPSAAPTPTRGPATVACGTGSLGLLPKYAFASLRQGSPSRLPFLPKASRFSLHTSGATDRQAMARRLRLGSGVGLRMAAMWTKPTLSLSALLTQHRFAFAAKLSPRCSPCRQNGHSRRGKTLRSEPLLFRKQCSQSGRRYGGIAANAKVQINLAFRKGRSETNPPVAVFRLFCTSSELGTTLLASPSAFIQNVAPKVLYDQPRKIGKGGVYHHWRCHEFV